MTRFGKVFWFACGLAGLVVVPACFFSPPECELCGDPDVDVCVPALGLGPPPDACGTFVSRSLGSDAAKGSKAEPRRSLAAVLAAASVGARVYACGERFDEALVIPAGVSLFGALDCAAGFRYAPAAAKTEIAAPAGAVALTFAPGTAETLVADLQAVAAPAERAGGSSIAALADHARVALVRTALVAGDAADGADGAPFVDVAASGGAGKPGKEACSALLVSGAAGPETACAGPGSSIGGRGGDGAASVGGDGEDGDPSGAANHGDGAAANPPGATCSGGTMGVDGVDGAAGVGGVAIGRVDALGYVGADGEDGASGAVAQGGGGGGGAKGGSGPGECGLGGPAGGASGGSGGAGGCGGLGGRGGRAGGASLALVSLESSFRFEDVALGSGRGGNGGSGSPGQIGGGGGKGGAGGPGAGVLAAACAGGPGGVGAAGGRGGGGAGGHSVGIAFTGEMPELTGTDIGLATAGMAGAGQGPSGAGNDGLVDATLALP